MPLTIEEALKYEYGQGFAAGIQLTLELLLGEADVEGVVPFEGSETLPDDVRQWARDSLARVREAV